MRTIFPQTKDGRIAEIEKKLAAFDEMLETGVFSTSVDGLTITYRTRNEIERERSSLKVELVKLKRGRISPMGGTAYEL